MFIVFKWYDPCMDALEHKKEQEEGGSNMEGKGRWYGWNWSLSPSRARRPAGTATAFIS
jgi:hypothetical protein